MRFERRDVSDEGRAESGERRDLRIYRHHLSELLIIDINILRREWSAYFISLLISFLRLGMWLTIIPQILSSDTASYPWII